MPVKKANHGGLIGIWWYTDEGHIWAVKKPADEGALDGPYLHYSDTESHFTLWKRMVTQNISDSQAATARISLGFKSLERGRVIYDTRTQCYEVTCSETLYLDNDFRTKIKKAYNLEHSRVTFVHLHHYRKLCLTGNPVLDAIYYIE